MRYRNNSQKIILVLCIMYHFDNKCFPQNINLNGTKNNPKIPMGNVHFVTGITAGLEAKVYLTTLIKSFLCNSLLKCFNRLPKNSKWIYILVRAIAQFLFKEFHTFFLNM